jgi:hypothetical protein
MQDKKQLVKSLRMKVSPKLKALDRYDASQLNVYIYRSCNAKHKHII